MKKFLLFSLALFFAATPFLLSQTSVLAPPSIPEEARRHFVMGETMFKEAKNVDAFTQAVVEFTEAAILAPQWPEARYNLALAKEAAGDYSGAMAELKLYQQFKLSETEARTVQDKIYAIEAKQKMEASDAADAANAQANSTDAKLKRFIKSLDGAVWHLALSNGYEDIECSGNTLTKTGWNAKDGRLNLWKISFDGATFEHTVAGDRETGSISTDGETITLTNFLHNGTVWDRRVYVRK